MDDLFEAMRPSVEIGEGALWLPNYAVPYAERLMQSIEQIAAQAPFRKMMTPGGRLMSVMTTSCGQWGWQTDEKGYRYIDRDPVKQQPWPEMPSFFKDLAVKAAAEAGYLSFSPSSCLINRYAPDAQMGIHQDRDEGWFSEPIVSISLGVPARFAFGGVKRSDPLKRFELRHGDVVVWGGASRLAWHGISRLKKDFHPLTGDARYNLTFRVYQPR
ncbi:DNA oxidative demethylase AlkB [Swingsia samuiensis]|uniref:DNA oxidative demethylase AlkB n=1 Tax=Swingsia samuiensis TaxID=1293412 RepID=A0A4Y6UIQ4_9PROT|nr:DNA oxidative demethylase AlkB [Swingsia samuiensis]QDH17483.1 DNA oxidative demethylase AlkB [Swingsia samuiensis]